MLNIIILTYNEENNIEACLDSFRGVQAGVWVVDSFSTDRTLELLDARGIPYVQHPFANYAAQRNWAEANCPLPGEWIFHLDAGERFTPELVQWLNTSFDPNGSVAGYQFSRRTYFLGRWMRRGGHYPSYHLRLVRKGQGHCEHKAYDQHFVLDRGQAAWTKAGIDIIDDMADNLHDFSLKHARWALYEAVEIVDQGLKQGEVRANLGGNPIEKRRWLKEKVFQRFPLFLRSFAYFFYRYIVRGGFRDGAAGLVFHFLQGAWFRFLVDAYVLEIRQNMQSKREDLPQTVIRLYGERFLGALKR